MDDAFRLNDLPGGKPGGDLVQDDAEPAVGRRPEEHLPLGKVRTASIRTARERRPRTAAAGSSTRTRTNGSASAVPRGEKVEISPVRSRPGRRAGSAVFVV